jgi:uncharacterized protein (DUF2267 family)
LPESDTGGTIRRVSIQEAAVEYQKLVDRVKELPFIDRPGLADASVKAVLGILASRLPEAEARRLADRLPEPLTLEKLRGHQRRPDDLSVDQYYGEIAKAFNMTGSQADQIVRTVLKAARRGIGRAALEEIAAALPDDWTRLLLPK